MGLDMYLTKKLYIWQDKRKKLKLTGLPVRVNPKEIKQIEAEAGYWRKANAIHGWFVDHVQGGVDECQEAYVSRKQLQELLDTVNKVMEDHSLVDELLPLRDGFFFGSRQIDDSYFESLKDTQKILTKALKAPEDWEFYYQSSW